MGDLASRPAPVGDYSASVAAIRAEISAEQADSELNPAWASRLLAPGRRTERVVVLFHGFTNCPAQFEPLAGCSPSGATQSTCPGCPTTASPTG